MQRPKCQKIGDRIRNKKTEKRVKKCKNKRTTNDSVINRVEQKRVVLKRNIIKNRIVQALGNTHHHNKKKWHIKKKYLPEQCGNGNKK